MRLGRMATKTHIVSKIPSVYSNRNSKPFDWNLRIFFKNYKQSKVKLQENMFKWAVVKQHTSCVITEISTDNQFRNIRKLMIPWMIVPFKRRFKRNWNIFYTKFWKNVKFSCIFLICGCFYIITAKFYIKR